MKATLESSFNLRPIGPDLRIGYKEGADSSFKGPNFNRFGLKCSVKNFSHLGKKDDKSGPLSVIVEKDKVPLKSSIR